MARLPVVLKAAVEMAAAQGDDGVGTANRSEHPRLFEPGTDYGLAPGFDHPRADKEVLVTKLGIAQARCVSLKVVGLDANFLDHFGVGGNDGMKGAYQLFDFPLVE